jgi:hypothetical protein
MKRSNTISGGQNALPFTLILKGQIMSAYNDYKEKMVKHYEEIFSDLDNYKREHESDYLCNVENRCFNNHEQWDHDKHLWRVRQIEVAGGKGIFEKWRDWDRDKYSTFKEIRYIATKDAERKWKRKLKKSKGTS